MFSKLQHFSLMVKNTIIKHPLEILFVTYVTLVMMNNIGDYQNLRHVGNLVALAPICFILLYLMRNTKAYWLLTPVPIIVALFYDKIGLDLMIDSRYWAVALCTFLCLISQFWHKDNHAFVDEMTNKLVNIVFAGALASIIFGVLSCITVAIIALFNLDDNSLEIFEHFGIFSSFWAFPALFLTLEQQHATNDSRYLNRIGEMLLNWILSPSLIIYTAIIYAYVVFIAAKGQMPNGVVANVAFPYLTLGLAIQAVQLLLKNAKWQWFYRYFAYLALLPLALVWYAIYIRLNHYGFTEARIYLVIGAITLTICYGLLISKRFAQYRLFSAISIVIILVSVFILDPQKIAINDQEQRLDSYLTEHKLLDANGKINEDAVREYKKSLGENKEEIQHFNSMLYYVSREYPVEKFKAKYGVESGYDLVYKTDENTYDSNRFEVTSSDVLRLRQADMAEMKTFILLDARFNRLNTIEKIDHKQCQKLTSYLYDLSSFERKDTYTKADCDSLKAEPTELVIELTGLEQNLKFNINDKVKEIFAKHHLTINERHQAAELEKIKADLLKIEVNDKAELGLSSIELIFQENIGYVVDYFYTRYLILK